MDYFYDEMRIMHGILTTWIQDILRYIVEHAGADDPSARAASAGIARMLEAYPIGQASRERCQRSHCGRRCCPPQRTGSTRCASSSRTRTRCSSRGSRTCSPMWRATWGEEAVLDSILETHQSIWGDRYARWDQMTPLEKLALTVEGMRGGHFSGARRRGDMTLIDEGDRYRMVMDPCGSGGVLRRGDPETGRAPYPIDEHGTNQEPHLWTWQKTGIHWYCAHCCISMEWLPGRKRGRPLRPLDHVMDPAAPCTWYIYKDEAQTRAPITTRAAASTRRPPRPIAARIGARSIRWARIYTRQIEEGPMSDGLRIVFGAVLLTLGRKLFWLFVAGVGFAVGMFITPARGARCAQEGEPCSGQSPLAVVGAVLAITAAENRDSGGRVYRGRLGSHSGCCRALALDLGGLQWLDFRRSAASSGVVCSGNAIRVGADLAVVACRRESSSERG